MPNSDKGSLLAQQAFFIHAVTVWSILLQRSSRYN